MNKAKVTELLFVADGANTSGTPVECPPWRESGRGLVVASINGTGAIASSVAVQGSHDRSNWFAIGTIALTANTTDTDALGIDYPWPFIRAVSSGASGTMGGGLRVTLAQ